MGVYEKNIVQHPKNSEKVRNMNDFGSKLGEHRKRMELQASLLHAFLVVLLFSLSELYRYNVAPKSDTIICPVIARDSSLARKSKMFATSSGIQIGTERFMCFCI